ncbi:MAG: LysR family transcriptional regulator [Solirubrobacteraceae bacterium]
MSFKTDHLRYFVTVAEEGQITRAAKRLYIAQPALSQAISQLESELGLSLLERHPRGVRLTATGETFLEKARAVLASELDVQLTAESLARAARGALAVGFVGPPPALTSAELFASFAERNPRAEVSFHDLPFPRGSTEAWLETVDVAFCHGPTLVGDSVHAQPVRVEPRALVAHRTHPLAGDDELEVGRVLDETFISYHPEVQKEWAGFHSLDDHRGGPPASMTADHVASGLQMLGLLGKRGAVTTLPLGDAEVIAQALPEMAVVPLRDAAPAVVSLVWCGEAPAPLVITLAETASALRAEANGAGSA